MLESNHIKCQGGLRTQGHFKQPLPDKPLVSVITVVFNGEKYLEETIQSVINQSYANVEYIIIDGGSTDKTVDVIRKYENQIDYWVSESDDGIYDGMNKGIKLAVGDWINFMNAGDSFNSPQLINEIRKNFFSDYSIIYSDVLINDQSRTIIQSSREHEDWWKGTPFCHQAAFFSTKEGKFYYDLSHSLAADYEYALKIFSCSSSAKKENNIIARYDASGISSRKSFSAALQMYSIANKYYKFNFYMHFYYAMKLFRRLLNSYQSKT